MLGVFSFVCFSRRRSLVCLEYLVLFVFQDGTNKTKYSKHTSERRLEKQTKLNTPNILVNAVLKNKQNLRRRSLVCLEYLVLFVF
jgi:hypothetical protein